MNDNQMWAVQYRSYGGPEVIEVGTADVPQLKDHQVLVEVSAFSINQLDLDMRAGRMKPLAGRGFPKGTGVDFTGTVVRLGGGVEGVRTGDRVWGYVGMGAPGRSATAAQYVAVRADRVAAAPTSVSAEQAAALPLVALTALQACRGLRVGTGRRVLVVGGNGGVGSTAIQVARALGAEVDAVVGGHDKAARQAGARRLYSYRSGGPEQVAERYDAVLNVAGANVLAYRRVVGRGGRVMALSPAAAPAVLVSCLTPGPMVRIISARSDPKDLTWLAQRVDDGTIVPIVDTVYNLEDVGRAHRDADAASASGKRVVVAGRR